MNESSALRYYRSLVGAWSGQLDYALTDRVALRDAVPGWFIRFGFVSLALASRLGMVRFATTLDVTDTATGPSITHTTRVSSLGMTLFASTESIVVDEGASTFRMKGEQRARFTPPLLYEGPGEIEPSATRALYRIPFFGRELVQRTEIVPEGLTLTQETPWSNARVVLRRRQPKSGS